MPADSQAALHAQSVIAYMKSIGFVVLMGSVACKPGFPVLGSTAKT